MNLINGAKWYYNNNKMLVHQWKVTYFIHGFISTFAFRNEGNPLLQIEVEPTSDVSPLLIS